MCVMSVFLFSVGITTISHVRVLPRIIMMMMVGWWWRGWLGLILWLGNYLSTIEKYIGVGNMLQRFLKISHFLERILIEHNLCCIKVWKITSILSYKSNLHVPLEFVLENKISSNNSSEVSFFDNKTVSRTNSNG